MKTKAVQAIQKIKSFLIKAQERFCAPVCNHVISFARKHFTRQEAVLFGVLFCLALIDQFTALYTARDNTSAVNILRSFFSFFTIFINPSYICEFIKFTDFAFIKDVFCWAGLLMVPVLLTGRFFRHIYLLVIILTTISDCAIIFAHANFKLYLDGDWVGIVLASDPKEFSTFFNTYATQAFVGMFVAIVFFVLSFMVTSKLKTSRTSKTRALIAVAITILFCIAMPIPKAFTTSPMCRFTANTVKEFSHYRRLAKLKTSPEIPELTHNPPQIPHEAESENTTEENKNVAKTKENVPSAAFVASPQATNKNSCAVKYEGPGSTNMTFSGLMHSPGNKIKNNSVHGVFILGESATRNHWSIYVYPNKTTPRMENIRDELFIFNNLVTPISNTAKAMELIFTQSCIENLNNPKCTYAQMLKSSGYDVSHYSSQSRWGKWDGVESFIFAGADPLVFIEEEKTPGSEWHDDSLLEYLDNDISSKTNHTVTILHLVGSHFPAHSHYPNENGPLELKNFIKDTAGPNAATNEYDNSIFFTDMLLGSTIDKLKERGGFSWMIYISDHGDSIGANSFRLTNDRNVWEVPMIVWLSEDYKKAYPELVKELKSSTDKPLQSDLLLPGFLRIAGISGWDIGTEKDFLNQNFKPRKPRVIEGGKFEYYWDKIQPPAPPSETKPNPEVPEK